MARIAPTLLCSLFFILASSASASAAEPKANVIIILADDMGYGDLACYGHPKFKTPNIDRMAAEGGRLTHFNTPMAYCAPTRASLMTGRYPFRCGLTANPAPDSGKQYVDLGLPVTEITLADVFHRAGYATGIIGKWHLGHQPQFLPTRRGFDEYFGIPYSNDMRPVQLLEGDKVVEYPVVQATLTQRYTERALNFIESNRDRPFFLYFPEVMPHKPLAVSEKFYRKSGAGLYGDAISELDWSVGQVLAKVKELGLDERTFIVFASDNGPWYGGSTGGLRGMKSVTWEGGYRVPCIARWPGKVPPGHVSAQPAIMMDLFATALKAAGLSPPNDRVIDGQDILPLFTSDAASPHDAIIGMQGDKLANISDGRWKLHILPAREHLEREDQYDDNGRWIDPRGPDGVTILAPYEQYQPSAYPGLRTGDAAKAKQLFDLQNDPGEQHDVTADHPDVVKRLTDLFNKANGDTGKRAMADETDSIGMKLKPIPAGTFQMGQAEREKSFRNPWSAEKDTGADWDETPLRQVKITHPFLMGATEVTNAQYEQFDPNHHALRSRQASAEDNAAVVNVSWDDATAYCKWLSTKEGKPYRLPTEAEWEYACRAGTTTFFNTGDSLPDGYQQLVLGGLEGFSQFFPTEKSIAAGLTSRIDQLKPGEAEAGVVPRYYKQVKRASLLVGEGPANAWGLYGMHGNAEEWCLDWYAPYDPSQTTDPAGPVDGDFRVIRGGAYSQLARLLRSANRLSMEPWVRNDKIGFRVVQADPVAPATARALPVPPSINPPLPAPVNTSVDITQPYFAGPARYVNIPDGSEGPLFSRHNHDPAVAVFPNGDVFILDYTCDTEFGHELAIAATRLPAGASAFTPPVLFWQCADVNNHAPALFVDKHGTIFHFNGSRAMPGSIVRTSSDNGLTWTPPRYIAREIQPSESNIQTADGRILQTCDSIYDNSGTVTMSPDDGRTWTQLSDYPTKPAYAPGGTGTVIAGIHVGLIERKDGTLWALGRVDRQPVAALFDYKLPISISTDGGKTWTYSISDFPDITSGQRMTLKRLKEGPLLLCTFTDDFAHRDAAGAVTGAKTEAQMKGMPFLQPDGTTNTGYGMVAALSYDDGATWPVKRLVTPARAGEKPIQIQITDGGAWALDATHGEPNGYLASCQGSDGRIHLISSRNYYVFNLAWVTEGTSYAKRP